MVTASDLTVTKPVSGFKRLGFVRDYSTYYWTKSSGLASQAWHSTVHYAPASLQPRLKSVEDAVADFGSPTLVRLQDKSDSVLHLLDDKVDYAALIASRYYSSAGSELSGQVQKQKEYHRENLERYKAARQAYLQKIEDAVGFVKQNGVVGLVKQTADAVLAQVEEAKKIAPFIEQQASSLTTKAQQAWHNFATMPSVQQTVAKTKPSVDLAWQKYLAAHDQVLSTTYYHKVVDSGSRLLSHAQETSVYQSAKTNIYPTLAPFADPAYDSITGNSYYKAAVDHFKPVSPHTSKTF